MDALGLSPKEFHKLEVGGYLLCKMRRADYLVWEEKEKPSGLSVIKEIADAAKSG